MDTIDVYSSFMIQVMRAISSIQQRECASSQSIKVISPE